MVDVHCGLLSRLAHTCMLWAHHSQAAHSGVLGLESCEIATELISACYWACCVMLMSLLAPPLLPRMPSRTSKACMMMRGQPSLTIFRGGQGPFRKDQIKWLAVIRHSVGAFSQYNGALYTGLVSCRVCCT